MVKCNFREKKEYYHVCELSKNITICSEEDCIFQKILRLSEKPCD